MTAPQPVKILLVDDLEENLVALEALLRDPGRDIHLARSGEAALTLMLEHEFAVALVDVQMPAMNGFELAELMRGTERTRRIPIVFVSAGRELKYAFRGYESGAVDFLYKPLDPQMVKSKVAVFVDLFRQRQALEVTQAQLERAVRMRDDFMSLVSHELRNPLNTLYLQVQLRKRMLGAGSAPDRASMLGMAERDERQVQRMIRLLDDILDVSRLRTGHMAVAPAPMDLAVLVRRACEGLMQQAQAAETALTHEEPEALAFVGDEFRLEQVITNLVSNALRYGQRQPVTVTLQVAGGEALICVRDSGPGIAPADQARIFEQFERADSAGEAQGLGLGLFISREIVRAHGGRIEVASRPGEGAAFTVALPVRASAS